MSQECWNTDENNIQNKAVEKQRKNIEADNYITNDKQGKKKLMNMDWGSKAWQDGKPIGL